MVVSIACWFHGVAHLMIDRPRRALTLFAAEALGILCLMFGVFTQPLLPPADWLSVRMELWNRLAAHTACCRWTSMCFWFPVRCLGGTGHGWEWEAGNMTGF